MSVLPEDALRFEIAPGETALRFTKNWANIKPDVNLPADITVGRRDELSDVSPGVCKFTVNNNHGRYSPRNPLGPWYGKLGVNTPLQVLYGGDAAWRDATAYKGFIFPETSFDTPSVEAKAAGLLLCVWLSAFDSTSITAPGSMTVGTETQGSDISRLVPAWESVGAGTTGSRTASGGDDSWASSAVVLPGASTVVEHVAVAENAPTMVTSASTRVGQWLVAIYGVGDDISGTVVDELPLEPVGMRGQWLTLADSGIAAFDESGSPWSPRVRMWARRVSEPGEQTVQFPPHLTVSNIHGHVLVLDDLDPAALVWEGSRRFTGFVAEWPTRWLDYVANSRVPIAANGILRRLGQGDEPLSSTLRRYVLSSLSFRRQGWMLDDDSGATSGAPIDADVADPFQTTGSFGHTDGVPAGLVSALSLSDGDTWSATAPDVDESSVTFLFRMEADAPSESRIIEFTTSGGDIRRWRLQIDLSPDELRLYGFPDEAVAAFGSETLHPDFFDNWLYVSVDLDDSGADIVSRVIVWVLRSDGTLDEIQDFTNEWSGNGPAGSITRFSTSVTANQQMGLLRTGRGETSFIADDLVLAMFAHEGEPAADRIYRLCQENLIISFVDADSSDSMPMGPQRPGEFLSLLRECERTDGGVLYEESFGLVYQRRARRYARPTHLALEGRHLDGSPEPTDDDQQLRNDVTVSRTEGSSARAKDDASIAAHDRYPETYEVNTEVDSILQQIAAWRLSLGTVDEMRWPVLPVHILPNNADLLLPWETMPIGGRAMLGDDIFPQLPGVGIDLLTDGWSEQFTARTWTARLNCVPASPWSAIVLDDPDLARLDSDGSESAAGLVLDGTAGGYASTPDQPAFHATTWVGGDFVVTVDSFHPTWDPDSEETLAAQYDDATDDRAWRLALLPGGFIRFRWSEDGASFLTFDTTEPVPASAGDRLAVRAYLDVDNGGDHSVNIYTASTADGTWSLLEFETLAGTTSVFDSSADLTVGARDNSGSRAPFSGVILSMTLWDGDVFQGSHDEGELVASPDFAAQPAGTTSFTDAQGNTWTTHNAGLRLEGASGDYASAPDDAALDITGDIDLRADVTLDDWASSFQSLVSKYDTTTDERSYSLTIRDDGGVALNWSEDGTSGTAHAAISTVNPTPGFSNRLAVRAALDVDDGGGNHVVTFYTASTIEGSWTQLGDPVTTAATTSLFASSTPLEVGAVNNGAANRTTGTIHAAEVRDGIDGTVVANPQFDQQSTDATSFTDAQGNAWSLHGDARIAGSSVVAATFVAGTDTDLYVLVTDGPLWTTATSATDLPFDVQLSGVVLHVTGVTTLSDLVQRFTVDQTPVNGVEKTIPAGSEIHVHPVTILAL